MTAPAVQQFFETPLIEVSIAAPDEAAVVAAALRLAERYTLDVSQPAAPRFAWVAAAQTVVVEPGMVQPLATSPGDFWVAACCIDAGGGGGGLMIEDPRAATAAAGVPGLDVSADPPVETIAPVAGGLTMFQAFLRHGLCNDGATPQRWVFVGLRAKPV
ncbi:hypothetical protein [Sphingomonas sp. LT1P40]|uniref:hypothetical protein n=1 Tax=Alteristakelama amylovorans TaxID=3096166 RepID=UPI002FCC6780